MNTPGITWTSSSRTDVGCVRDANEDSCLEKPDAGLWVVADGMGGYTAGDVASGMIVETLGALEPQLRLSDFVEQIEDCLVTVNRELRDYAAKKETNTIGSTVASLVANDRHAVCMWAGDSRIYRYRRGELEQVSQDHALVEELVEKGVLTRQQAAAHPQANLVTRAVGATDALFVDIEIVELEPDDVFVLCSDGLDKEVAEPEIAAAVESHQGGSLSNTLVELALSRGSRDNVTVITVHIQSTTDGESTDDDDDDEDTIPGRAGASSER